MTDKPSITFTVHGGEVFVGSKKIGTLKSLTLSLPSPQEMLSWKGLAPPDWPYRLASEFGEHPPRIFHEGP